MVHSTVLNPDLIEEQGLDQAAVEELEALHIEKDILFTTMRDFDPKQDEDYWQLRGWCVTELERIEFAMQRAWGFNEDRGKHSWWFQAPHCTCPKLDNIDILMTGCRDIRLTCPLHGN